MDVGYYVADLSTLANLAEIFGAVFVIVGLGFGLTLALYERSRCVDEPRGGSESGSRSAGQD